MKQETHKKLGCPSPASMFRRLTRSHLDGALTAAGASLFSLNPITMEVMIYGRSRDKFEKLFPEAKFEGYECNIRFAYYTIKKVTKGQIERLCDYEKIKVITIN